jgi:uncharacterized protein YidB (DUF937 family)
MGILDILLGGARGGQSSGGFSKIAMAMIALMLWQWYKSRSGGAQAPEPMPSPRGQARIPSDAPARVPQGAPAQIPSPSSGGDSDSDFGPLANPRNMQIPGGRGGGGRGRPMDDDEGEMDGPGGGSLGDILNDILRGGRGGGMPMPGDDEMDDPRGRRGGGRGMPMPRGPGGDGGLGDILGEILGGGRGMPGQRVAGGPQSDPFSELLQSAGIGGLGGLLAGGASGGVLGGLLQQFDQAGRGDAARSWVSTGDNVPVTPKDVENTFGSDIIDQIALQFGIDRNELLKGLSQMLPQVVDQLTPDGRLPTEQELSRRG